MNHVLILNLLLALQGHEECEMVFILQYMAQRNRNKYFRSTDWSSLFFEENLDIQFREDLRVTREDFGKILTILKNETQFVNEKDMSDALIIFLMFSTSTHTYRQLARCTGKSTTYIRTKIEKITAILFSIHHRYIKLPTDVEYAALSREFSELSPIHGTVMAVDGTHIEINAPRSEPAKYYNYKGYYSLNWLMGCDATMKFRFVFGPGYGSSNDAFIFRISNLRDWLENNLLQGYHIIGDGAYPQLPKLKRPFKGNLSEEEKVFNKRLCKQRQKIETAFGLFKNRFRKFKNMICKGENQFNIRVFISSIVLHNILIN